MFYRESNNKISYLGQKDAHEVLMAMIRMTEYTGLDKPIFRGFRGELSRQRSCLKCMEVNITCAKENFYCLPVSFMDSRSRKLSNAVKTSLVSTVGSVCNEDGCDGQEARHTATIVRHPRKLILLIKR